MPITGLLHHPRLHVSFLAFQREITRSVGLNISLILVSLVDLWERIEQSRLLLNSAKNSHKWLQHFAWIRRESGLVYLPSGVASVQHHFFWFFKVSSVAQKRVCDVPHVFLSLLRFWINTWSSWNVNCPTQNRKPGTTNPTCQTFKVLYEVLLSRVASSAPRARPRMLWRPLNWRNYLKSELTTPCCTASKSSYAFMVFKLWKKSETCIV